MNGEEMILGIDKIIETIKTQKLVEGLVEENLNFEGCGLDLRAGEILEMGEDEGYLHVETRKTPNYKLLGRFEEGKVTKVKLQSRKNYVVKTIETINVPENLFGIFFPRNTLVKSGLMAHPGRVDPGYKGSFTFNLFNTSNNGFEIEMGARIGNMIFIRVEGKTNLYKGQWQGGRTFIENEEKQVKQGARVN